MKIMKKNLKTIRIFERKFREISQENTYAEIHQPQATKKRSTKKYLLQVCISPINFWKMICRILHFQSNLKYFLNWLQKVFVKKKEHRVQLATSENSKSYFLLQSFVFKYGISLPNIPLL